MPWIITHFALEKDSLNKPDSLITKEDKLFQCKNVTFWNTFVNSRSWVDFEYFFNLWVCLLDWSMIRALCVSRDQKLTYTYLLMVVWVRLKYYKWWEELCGLLIDLWSLLLALMKGTGCSGKTGNTIHTERGWLMIAPCSSGVIRDLKQRERIELKQMISFPRLNVLFLCMASTPKAKVSSFVCTK